MAANGSNNKEKKNKKFALNMTIAFIEHYFFFFQFFSLVLHDQQRNENSVFMYSTANDSFLMMLDAHSHTHTG